MEKSDLGKVKILDKIRQFEKTEKVTSTYFLDPREVFEYENLYRNVNHLLFGGFDDAERKILIIGKDAPDVDEYISLLEITVPHSVSHREILGSILGTRN